jgi:hypothetical protein
MAKHDTYKLTIDSEHIGEFNSFQEAKEEQNRLGYNYRVPVPEED